VIKRYRVIPEYDGSYDLAEDPLGEVVKYEDLQHAPEVSGHCLARQCCSPR
jgi:hypothetical protein